MKANLLLTLLLCLGISAAVPQKLPQDKVPANVTAHFKQQFPNAVKPHWEMEKSDYEVNFSIGKTEWSANFDSAGTLLETEESIAASSLPQAVKESVKKAYPGYTIEEAEKVTKGTNPSFYEMEVEKNEKSFELTVAADGTITAAKAKDEKEKD